MACGRHGARRPAVRPRLVRPVACPPQPRSGTPSAYRQGACRPAVTAGGAPVRSWSDPAVRRAVLVVVEGVHDLRNDTQARADTERLNRDQAADLVMAEIRRLRMEDVTVLPTGLAPEERAAVWATVRHAAVAELAALGRLQPLLDDDSVQDVNINGCDEVWVMRSDGSKTRADPVADTDEELLRLGQRIARVFEPSPRITHTS